MAFISETDKARIAQAIREVEHKTSGELVTVIAQAADDYLFIPLLWASLIALLAPGVIGFLRPDTTFATLYALQLLSFIGLALVFRMPVIKMRLIPRSIKRARAARLAREQFFAQGLHLTRDRTGVLIFVAVAEHHVEILADQGINAKLAHNVWADAVTEFIKNVKAGRVVEGFLAAITRCGQTLAEHFPRAADDVNELPNRLIELES